jgi:hypothetical protein
MKASRMRVSPKDAVTMRAVQVQPTLFSNSQHTYALTPVHTCRGNEKWSTRKGMDRKGI